MPKKNMPKSIYYNLLILGWLCLGIGGCKTSRPAATYNANQHFTVSLYSIGTGINPEAKNAITQVINTYQKKGYQITYTDTPWGREGERLYCFNLQALAPAVYKDFFNELSQLLAGKQVHITEQGECK
jgi:hypothetical protein